VPNLGILKTLSICYYRIATEQEKDRKKEGKRNALYQRYQRVYSFILLFFHFMLFWGNLKKKKKKVRRGTFWKFFFLSLSFFYMNVSLSFLFLAHRCWVALRFTLKIWRHFMFELDLFSWFFSLFRVSLLKKSKVESHLSLECPVYRNEVYVR